MLHTDICIAGAGIIGLSLALELQAQGLNVIVVEAGTPLREASTAAAGMLAANDPHNPAQLSELSHLSISLYPEFLARVQHLGGIGGIAVPFQTSRTLQQMPGSSQDNRNGTPASLSSAQLHSLLLDLRGGAASFRSWDDTDSSLSSGFTMLEEHSLDPRQLAAALLAAVKATSIQLFTETSVVSSISSANSVTVFTSNDTIAAAHLIDCTGSWVNDPSCQVKPIKGQMLAVVTPPELPLQAVVRTGEIYIVPRTTGPNAGRSIIGATIEDVGFDKTVHPHQIADLRRQAAELLPQLAQAPMLESWSGLRPATPDHLPLLGAHPTKPRHWIAAGHYRNGILLAPATAHVMAQLLLDRSPSVSLDAYSPGRASLLKASHLWAATRKPSTRSHKRVDIRPRLRQRFLRCATLGYFQFALEKHRMTNAVAPKGLEGIVATTSSICFIDGDAGVLSYRGIDIHELAKQSTFEETTYLLWFGKLPNAIELASFTAALSAARVLPPKVIELLHSVPADATPMQVLRTAVSLLSIYDADEAICSHDANVRKAYRLTAQIAMIVAVFDRIRKGKTIVEADLELSHAANFLWMLNGEKPSETATRAFDIALILHADHELNASTFAARVIAATLADIHSAITGAIGALKGPLHGGANEATMRLLYAIDKAGADPVEYVRQMFADKKKISGFGHRVYHTEDPRATHLRRMSEELGAAAGNTKWFDLSRKIELFVKSEKKLNANVDFYSASTYTTLGIDIDLFTPIFAVSRISGWAAHVIEQHDDNRLIRPRADYLGPVYPSPYTPLEARS